MEHEVMDVLGGPRAAAENAKPVYLEGKLGVYWMQRAQRIEDNPAFNGAVRLCSVHRVPLVILFCIDAEYPQANLRHFHFMLKGLDEVAVASRERGIPFLLLEGKLEEEVARFISQVQPAFVVTDQNPLRYGRQVRAAVGREAHCAVLSVDADVVVPSSLFTKEEYAARTFRPKLHRELSAHLGPVGTAKPHYQDELEERFWAEHAHQPSDVLPRLKGLSKKIQPVARWVGGGQAGWRRAHAFIEGKLDDYGEQRNRPERDGTSGLSPYLHFGQIGVGQLAHLAHEHAAQTKGREAFLEELLVRRELAINYVWHNPNYDSLQGCHPWAQKSLAKHSEDPRPVLYSLEQLIQAETHDPLWNAAQLQLVHNGWMHGYMRMYWAKKILEWSASPEQALSHGLYLNDAYSLDGRDCNGYTGLAWAIGGKHDRAWGPEREIFGMVRYMSYESTRRKFKSKEYIQQQSSR